MPVMDDAKIIKKARNYVRTYGTRDPECLARELGVRIHDADFIKLKGVYKVILRNPFIFIKKDLDPVTRKIVLLHELGHHALHRKEAQIFQEFSLFTDMTVSRMEYEANLFAAEISLPDDEILEYIYQGNDAAFIAAAMESDVNLVALKVADLNRRARSAPARKRAPCSTWRARWRASPSY